MEMIVENLHIEKYRAASKEFRSHLFLLINSNDRTCAYPKGVFGSSHEDILHFYPSGHVSLISDVEAGYALACLDLQRFKFRAEMNKDGVEIFYVGSREFQQILRSLVRENSEANDNAIRLLARMGF